MVTPGTALAERENRGTGWLLSAAHEGTGCDMEKFNVL